MQLINSRNPHSAMASFLQMMHIAAEQEGKMLHLRQPCIFTWDHPCERLIFYPGFARNPAKELRQALQSIAQTESVILPAAESVLQGARHFLFSTPQLVLQANIDGSGCFNMAAVISETNPFLGAFGQLALQMSILHELLARSIKRRIGTLSIQHMNISVPEEVIRNFLRSAYDNEIVDPYEAGTMKARKLDAPLDLQMLTSEDAQALGYKSKWVRQVALPLFSADAEETPEECLEECQRIKADDWRQAMIEWTETRIMAKKGQDVEEAE